MDRSRKRTSRTLIARARWSYLRVRWKLRRRYALAGQGRSPSLRIASLALFPFLILLTASAAIVGVGRTDRSAQVAQGPFFAASERALAGYRDLRLEVVGEYASRFRVGPTLASLIYETAIEERVDPDLAFRLVRTESSFHPAAVGPAGAVGLAQVRPSTARWLDSTITRERLFEAGTNLRLGFRYLRMLLDMYDHDTRLALLAYNRGPGTVAALLAIDEDPANGYASRVMGVPRVRQIVADAGATAPMTGAGAPMTAPPESGTAAPAEVVPSKAAPAEVDPAEAVAAEDAPEATPEALVPATRSPERSAADGSRRHRD